MIKLSATEREIMEVIWSMDGASNNEIVQYFANKGKMLARQTTHTFLTRMMKKGLITRENHKFYPVYTKEDVEQQQARQILDTLYGSSLENFFSALNHGQDKLTAEEVEELKKMIGSIQ